MINVKVGDLFVWNNSNADIRRRSIDIIIAVKPRSITLFETFIDDDANPSSSKRDMSTEHYLDYAKRLTSITKTRATFDAKQRRQPARADPRRMNT